MARAIASQEHLGKSVVVYPRNRNWAFDSHLMRLRFNLAKAEPEFVPALVDDCRWATALLEGFAEIGCAIQHQHKGDFSAPHSYPRSPPTRVRCPGVSSGAVEGGAAGVFGETGRALRLPPAPRLPGGTMTLGRDILYAALAGLMHGGLTIYPAQWAGLKVPRRWRCGAACNRHLSSRVGLKNVAPLALWGGRETSNRQCRPSACQAGWKHIAPLALWSRPKGRYPPAQGIALGLRISMILCGLKGRVNPHHATIIIAHPGSPDFQHERPCPCITPAIRSELHPYLAVVLRDNDCPSLRVGVLRTMSIFSSAWRGHCQSRR